MDWWKCPHGLPLDPAWLVIADATGSSPAAVCSLVFTLRDYASRQRDRGSIAGFNLVSFANFNRLPVPEARAMLAALGAGDYPIHQDNRLIGWDVEQIKHKSDSTAAARKRRQRETAKEQSAADKPKQRGEVTPSHAVTERDISVTFSDVTPCHALSRHVTPRDIDREEQERKRELFSALDVASAVTPKTIESVSRGSTDSASARMHTPELIGDQEPERGAGWFGGVLGKLARSAR